MKKFIERIKWWLKDPRANLMDFFKNRFVIPPPPHPVEVLPGIWVVPDTEPKREKTEGTANRFRNKLAPIGRVVAKSATALKHGFGILFRTIRPLMKRSLDGIKSVFKRIPRKYFFIGIAIMILLTIIKYTSPSQNPTFGLWVLVCGLAILAIALFLGGAWLAKRPEQRGESEKQAEARKTLKRIGKRILYSAGGIMLIPLGLLAYLLRNQWELQTLKNVGVGAGAIIVLIATIWGAKYFLKKRAESARVAGVRTEKIWDNPVFKAGLVFLASALFMGVYIKYLSKDYGLDAWNVLGDLILPFPWILVFPFAVMGASIASSRWARWPAVLSAFFIWWMVYAQVAGAHEKKVLAQSVAIPPAERRWIMQWQKHNENGLPSPWNDWEDHYAIISQLDNEHFDIKMYYENAEHFPEVLDFVWDKKADPLFGRWSRKNPAAKGKWLLRPVVENQDNWWFAGLLIFENGNRINMRLVETKKQPRPQ